jgi:PhzF family phenazine biosynthesis protein
MNLAQPGAAVDEIICRPSAKKIVIFSESICSPAESTRKCSFPAKKGPRVKLPIFQIDAFAGQVFHGNPAAVCPLDEWIDDAKMQAIASENNLAETAFFVRKNPPYQLRWFTPTCEVDLCGHATLASGLVFLNRLEPSQDSVEFATRSGPLTVRREGDLFALELPAMPPWGAASIPADLQTGLELAPQSLWQVKNNYFAIYKNEVEVGCIRPNFAILERLHPFGVCITARGNNSDFVSRYFAPSYGIPEDPVTGSTHCSLTPYWAHQLSKPKLHALQVSQRGGELWCELAGDRVFVKGKAALYMEGTISV